MRTARPEPSGFAAKARDLQALRDAVVEASAVSGALWLSYILVFLYLAIAAGAVTHKDLFFENPVKLPFLNVELPLIAFFVLGPALFLIVHWYTLLHFALLAGKVGAFHTELEAQIHYPETRARLRRQLPSNIFVQFLAGPRDTREGLLGLMLRLIAWISLIVGPVALLVLFQLQFLPYHNEAVCWWQRISVVIDLVLLWVLWPLIARGTNSWLGAADFLRGRIAGPVLLSILPALLVFAVATFPGEWLHDIVPPGPREFLAGGVDYVAQRPTSWPSNRLVLPFIDLRENPKSDTPEKIASRPTTLSFRGRRLENAVLDWAYLPKADFTGAQLQGAHLFQTQLQGASLENAQLQGASLNQAQLQGAWLNSAQLQGASLFQTQLQGATLSFAQLQGASLHEAQLQGASLNFAQLQGADLSQTQLQGASLHEAQLQGASLLEGQLQGASLVGTFVWRTDVSQMNAKGAYVDNVVTGPKYQGFPCYYKTCDWSAAPYAELRWRITDRVPAGREQKEALALIARLDPNNPDRKPESQPEPWADLEKKRPARKEYDKTLADMLQDTGCKSEHAPHVVASLARNLGGRFEEPREASRVAAAFLDEANCPGAHGLSDEAKAVLRQIRDSAPPLAPEPAISAESGSK